VSVKPGFLSEIFVSFQGEGAHVGRRHLFVRLAGCNIRCRYCDTPDSLERTEGFTIQWNDRTEYRQNPVRAVDVALVINSLLREAEPIDAVALTGGEPLTQSEFLAELLGAAQLSVPALLETNGVLPRRLPDVLPLVDIISMDVKLPSNTGEGSFWDEHAEFLERARAGAKDIYIKILVDQETKEEDVLQAAMLVARSVPTAPVFLQPIVDERGRCSIDAAKMTQLFIVARGRVPSVRVLPQTHKFMQIH